MVEINIKYFTREHVRQLLAETEYETKPLPLPKPTEPAGLIVDNLYSKLLCVEKGFLFYTDSDGMLCCSPEENSTVLSDLGYDGTVFAEQAFNGGHTWKDIVSVYDTPVDTYMFNRAYKDEMTWALNRYRYGKIDTPCDFVNGVMCSYNLRVIKTYVFDKLSWTDAVRDIYTSITENISFIPNEIIRTMYKKYPYLKDSPIQDLVTSIDKPEIYRDYENPNKDTFDFVSVSIHLVSENKEYRNDKLRKNKDAVRKLVASRVKEDKGFQKYGVPIGMLKIDKLTITSDDRLVAVLGFKSVSK